jgi:UDP-N-acetylmuramoyl-tripeptide--D-alanyl-D-alanine ligase
MRKYIARILKWQAQKYIAKNNPKIVVISGSIGKTSTTQAIATIVSQSFKVRTTLANYNTDVGIPCSIFGYKFPKLIKNPFGWAWIIVKNQIQMLSSAQFEVLVLEIGTDSPGELLSYSWLNPDIAVVTAVAPEHMEFFKNIEAVAKEELSVASFAQKTIINKDMIDVSYLKFAETDQLFNYSRTDIEHIGIKPTELQVIGKHSVDAITAGLAVGKEFGMSMESLRAGALAVTPQPGRMNKLKGIDNSILIDDTYNSSPEAVIAGLDYIYSLKNTQKIVLLGNMNELGETSAEEHRRIGQYCDYKKLHLVVTLGVDANNYTATEAKNNGCLVETAQSPYEAADIIKKYIRENAVVLLKGSQNGVYAEEATKLLLSNPEDEKLLVRQSPFWMKIKHNNFKEF